MVSAPPRPALTDVVVAPMRRRHLRGVLEIEQRVYPRPWSMQLFASELALPESRRYVVALAPVSTRSGRGRMHKQVVGYAGVLIGAGEAHVTTVAVHPEFHRRKIASRLLVALLDEARGLGANAATLEVRVANRGAQRLYGAFGFAPVGVRPGYYSETGEDALIMWAHDIRSAAYTRRLDEQRARLSEPGGSSGAPDHDVPHVKGRIGLEGESE